MLIGEMDYYSTKTVKALTDVTKRFYKNWDDHKYKNYLKDFGIDENKQIKALSSGMKVKYGLALALSRGAKILLLDEPTSGLDPVSRDELMDIFLDLVSDKEHAILFSTHVISDLEKCADQIIYIKSGKIIVNEDVTSFESSYLHYAGDSESFAKYKDRFIFYRDRLGKFEGIIRKEYELDIDDGKVEKRKATMEEIMVAFERGEKQ
jgi:ABC-2 type transport system ATP-binding protein